MFCATDSPGPDELVPLLKEHLLAFQCTLSMKLLTIYIISSGVLELGGGGGGVLFTSTAELRTRTNLGRGQREIKIRRGG